MSTGEAAAVRERTADVRRDSSLRAELDVGVPALIRVAEMLVQLLFLSWLDPRGGPSLTALLTKWDAAYYGSVAASWYPANLPVGSADQSAGSGSTYAFYPLYPILVAPFHAVGFATAHALLITSALCGIAASVFVHLLAREIYGSRRAGYLACAALGALPMAVTFQMGYAESLYVALVAATLLAAVRGKWWLAGVLALACGLTRPSGILVPLALPAAAWAARRSHPVRWGRVAGATVVGFAGSPLFWLYLWSRSGVSDAWFAAEKRGWDSHIDFGKQTWQFLRGTLQHPDGAVMGPITAAVIVGFVVASLLALIGRHPPPLVVVSVLSVALALGATNYWHSKPRLLLTAFPIVVLAAGALARLRDRTSTTLLATAVLASSWFGAYALAIWPYAI